MIETRAISKRFGEIAAVRDVSLTAPEGGVTILVGADGAGKSTIFKMLVGLVRKDSGAILLRGEDIGDRYSDVTSITGYMPERFSLYPDLTVEENLNFFADIHQVAFRLREERKHRLLEKTVMANFCKRRAGALSGGMKQKLALSCILLQAPQLIILDEPTTGVDPLSRIEFFNIITDLRAEGKTILISTPYLDEAEQGDYVVFLKEGRTLLQSDIAGLKRNFPARLFALTPKGDIYEILENLQKDEALRDNVYIRGKYLKYLHPENADITLLNRIPHTERREENPRLEDIYLYHERKNAPTTAAQ